MKEDSQEKLIGKIVHYYGNISVGIIELSDDLKSGDTIHVKGEKTDFQQEVQSMQFDHQDVTEARAGSQVGVKLKEKVREGDSVFRLA